MGSGRSEIFLGDCDPNAQSFSSSFIKKGSVKIRGLKGLSDSKVLIHYIPDHHDLEKKLILAVGVTICSLIKKVLRS